MDTWNREELYRDIWQTPMLKLTEKYGVSAVMLGKVCRKLRIPVPGRGYWARKAAGQKLTIKPLPQIKSLPVIQRLKPPSPPETKIPDPEPTDPEYLKILDVEALKIAVDPAAPLHRLVAATAKDFKSRSTDYRGYRSTRRQSGVFGLNISERTLERALRILNAVVLAVERQGYAFKFSKDGERVFTTIFEQEIGFEIIEKYSQVRIPEEQRKRDIFSSKIRIEPNGNLEFRATHPRWGYSSIQDHKRKMLEDQVPMILGVVLGRARSAKLSEELSRQREIEQRAREIERFELSEQIREEEKKIATLDTWVTNWSRAKLYRDFITELESAWIAKGEDLAEGSERANRLIWMRHQADRLDPLVKSPASILDRKDELNRY